MDPLSHMQPPNKTQLIRGLTLVAAISIVVGNVIGTGVFLKTRIMTCNVGTPGKVLAVWVAAGLLSLAGALTYAELAAMMPRAGGEYVFIREAYGARWGFLYGWMSFFIGKAGSQAALAVGLAIFLNDRRRYGVFINGYRRGATLPLTLALGGGMIVLLVASIHARDAGLSPWTKAGIAGLTFAFATAVSVVWQRVYLRELRGGRR